MSPRWQDSDASGSPNEGQISRKPYEQQRLPRSDGSQSEASQQGVASDGEKTNRNGLNGSEANRKAWTVSYGRDSLDSSSSNRDPRASSRDGNSAASREDVNRLRDFDQKDMGENSPRDSMRDSMRDSQWRQEDLSAQEDDSRASGSQYSNTGAQYSSTEAEILEDIESDWDEAPEEWDEGDGPDITLLSPSETVSSPSSLIVTIIIKRYNLSHIPHTFRDGLCLNALHRHQKSRENAVISKQYPFYSIVYYTKKEADILGLVQVVVKESLSQLNILLQLCIAFNINREKTAFSFLHRTSTLPLGLQGMSQLVQYSLTGSLVILRCVQYANMILHNIIKRKKDASLDGGIKFRVLSMEQRQLITKLYRMTKSHYGWAAWRTLLVQWLQSNVTIDQWGEIWYSMRSFSWNLSMYRGLIYSHQNFLRQTVQYGQSSCLCNPKH